MFLFFLPDWLWRKNYFLNIITLLFKSYRTLDRFVYVLAYINKSLHRCLESLQRLSLPLISTDQHLGMQTTSRPCLFGLEWNCQKMAVSQVNFSRGQSASRHEAHLSCRRTEAASRGRDWNEEGSSASDLWPIPTPRRFIWKGVGLYLHIKTSSPSEWQCQLVLDSERAGCSFAAHQQLLRSWFADE